jgi:hypothetical protein
LAAPDEWLKCEVVLTLKEHAANGRSGREAGIAPPAGCEELRTFIWRLSRMLERLLMAALRQSNL